LGAETLGSNEARICDSTLAAQSIVAGDMKAARQLSAIDEWKAKELKKSLDVWH
jgi:hypothetical protein